MRVRNIIARIELQRESRANHLLPYDNFLERISAAAQLLYFVEHNTKDKISKLEARKYFIIMCISSMEAYFKETAEHFIDARWTKENFLNSLTDTKIALCDLFEITKKSISIGEIVSTSQSFQGLEMIDKFYTNMLGVNGFIKEVQLVKLKTKKEEFTLKKGFPNFRGEIEEMIKLRHLIIHHGGPRRIGLRKLEQLYSSLNAFITAADLYTLGKIPEESAT